MALGSFTADLSKFAKKYPERVKMVITTIIFSVYKRTAGPWPKDTTRSAINWQIGQSLGSGIIEVNEPTDINVAFQRELGNLNALVIKDGVIGFIYNNVEYAIYLEYGHSKQAPNGCMRIALSEVGSFVNQAVAGLA